MSRKLIVPLDGSSTAEAALPLALRLAADDDVTICLVRVLRPLDSSEPVTATVRLSAGPRSEALDVEQRRAERELEVVADALRPDVDVTWTVRTGEPAATIAEYAREVGAAAIAMATHGRSGVARLALGSVAEQVLSLAPVPVFLVRSPKELGPMHAPLAVSPFADVVVPLDGSPLALAALVPLLEFGGETNMRVDLLQVVEPVPPAGVEGIVELPGETLVRARAELERVAEEIRRRGCEVAVHVRIGSPAETILALAQERGAGLVAMSTHGRSGISRLFFGSVVAGVARRSEVPLLVVNARVASRVQRPILRARDVMTRDVVSVRPDQSLAEVVDLLLSRRVSGFPVVGAGGRLVGIISAYDLVAWEDQRTRSAEGSAGLAPASPIRSAQDLRERKVSDIMTRPVVTVEPDTSVSAVARLLMDHLVNRVPVVQDDQVVGIVSRLDVVRALAVELGQTEVAALGAIH